MRGSQSWYSTITQRLDHRPSASSWGESELAFSLPNLESQIGARISLLIFEAWCLAGTQKLREGSRKKRDSLIENTVLLTWKRVDDDLTTFM